MPDIPKDDDSTDDGRNEPKLRLIMDEGFQINWTSSGRSGSGTIVIHLPDGAYTDSLKIVSSRARAKVLETLADRLSEEESVALEEQLSDLAVQVAESQEDDGAGSGKPADRLVHLIRSMDGVELFHVDDCLDEGYVTVPEGEHHDTYKLKSGAFQNWLSRLCFVEFREVPPVAAIKEAVGVLTAFATHEGPCRVLSTRVASLDGGIVIDLANSRREVVHVSTAGWEIKSSSDVDVRFLRRDGALPLPTPSRGGDAGLLRSLVNVADDDQWILLICTVVAYLCPRGPFPVMVLTGEHGAAKSTAAKMVQKLVDPNRGGLRRPPTGERDLIIGARHSWLLCFDNLSGIDPHLSDGICSILTGGGFAARRLYTDDEEIIFECQRPVVLNGIDDLDERADLLDRSVVLQLRSIPDANRRDEDELWAAFDRAAPAIFGGLMDVLVSVLNGRPDVEIAELPRMADFAKTATAAESALDLAPGAFMGAYSRNRDLAREMALDQSPFAQAVRKLARRQGSWVGTASKLLDDALQFAPVGGVRHSSWPRSGAGVGRAVRRAAAALRELGVHVRTGDRGAGKMRERLIRISTVDGSELPAASDSSDSSLNQNCPTESGPTGASGGMSDGSDGSDSSFGEPLEGVVSPESLWAEWDSESSADSVLAKNRPNCPNRPTVPGRAEGVAPQPPRSLFGNLPGGEA